MKPLNSKSALKWERRALTKELQDLTEKVKKDRERFNKPNLTAQELEEEFRTLLSDAEKGVKLFERINIYKKLEVLLGLPDIEQL